MKSKTWWHWWAKAIGEKASKCNKESDAIAIIRSFIFVTYLITNCFIIAGVIRHWNDGPDVKVYQYYEVPSNLPETQEKRTLQTNRNFLYD